MSSWSGTTRNALSQARRGQKNLRQHPDQRNNLENPAGVETERQTRETRSGADGGTNFYAHGDESLVTGQESNEWYPPGEGGGSGSDSGSGEDEEQDDEEEDQGAASSGENEQDDGLNSGAATSNVHPDEIDDVMPGLEDGTLPSNFSSPADSSRPDGSGNRSGRRNEFSAPDNNSPPPSNKGRKGKEMPWEDRAKVCFFYHHPLLGNKNGALTGSMFGVNVSTAKAWATKVSMTKKWIPIAEHLCIQDVLDYVQPPEAWREHPHLVELTVEERQQGLSRHVIENVNDTPQINKNMFRGVGARIEKSYANSGKKGALDRKPVKYKEEHEFVQNELEEYHRRGKALHMPQLLQIIKEQFTSGALYEYCLMDETPRSLRCTRQWVQRAVEMAGYQIISGTTNNKSAATSGGGGGGKKRSSAGSTASSPPPAVQKRRRRRRELPDNWKQLCIREAQRIREAFRKQNVHNVISTDEIILNYTENSSEVGYSSDDDDSQSKDTSSSTSGKKESFTLVVSMELRTSSLVFPFLIRKSSLQLDSEGTVSKKLPSSDGNHGMLVSCSTYFCQSVETLKLYLDGIRRLYRGRTVGVIVDSSLGPLVQEWVQSENRRDTRNTRLIVQHVDERVTPFLHPCNVSLRETLKEKLQIQVKRYEKALDIVSLAQDVRIPLLREDVIGFVKRAYSAIDKEQFSDRYISTGFDICGMNPYLSHDKHESYLTTYLDSLDDNRISELASHEVDFIDLSDKTF